MRLEIVLKSDLCTSSGENYNALIDTDIVYEEHGLPLIPAKRLKGVIREAALELVEFGLFKEEIYHELFGMEGIQNSAFILDNAYLENYEKYVKDLEHCNDQMLKHPQRVLKLYTYTRTQTALDENGTAKKNCLRTFRVVNSGLKFMAQLTVTENLTKKQVELLKNAVSMVKHIGMNRTRGMGAVEMSLLPDYEKTEENSGKRSFKTYKKNEISYKIRLNAAVLCKTSDDSQEKTEEYIPGDKILGILAGLMGKEEFRDLMGYEKETPKELIVSNAYFLKDRERCLPIPASYHKRKDQKFEKKKSDFAKSEEMTIKDMLFAKTDGIRRSSIGNGFITEDGVLGEVETQISYHHKRPEDKAVGHANGKEESSFYQLRSLCKDQEFSGYLLADKEQAEKILNVIGEERKIRIGNGKHTEYGNAAIQILGVKNAEEQENRKPTKFGKKKTTSKQFVLKLNAAVILYNEYGMPSADTETLLTYLAEKLKVEKDTLKIEKKFVNYEDIGGFQVTWHRRKQKFTALGKGSVFLITCKTNAAISATKRLFLGERVSEGYGEAQIHFGHKEDVTIIKEEKAPDDQPYEYQTDLIEKLRIVQCDLELKETARNVANQWIDQWAEQKEIKAVLAKLIFLKRTVPTLKEMKEIVLDIKMEENQKLAVKILHEIEKCDACVRVFEEELLEEKAEEILYEVMLPEYLAQLKFRLKTIDLQKKQREESL